MKRTGFGKRKSAVAAGLFVVAAIVPGITGTVLTGYGSYVPLGVLPILLVIACIAAVPGYFALQHPTNPLGFLNPLWLFAIISGVVYGVTVPFIVFFVIANSGFGHW